MKSVNSNYLFKALLAILFLSLFSQVSFCQTTLPFEFEKNTYIKCFLENESDTLKNPWTGGFNAPQFWEMHLDNDGLLDLVVFDRTGNKLLTFKKEDELHEYIYYPEWEKYFPPVQNWIILKDYNGDGAKDLFTSAGNGITVYTNKSSLNSPPEFELSTDLLTSNYGNGDFNLFVSLVDLPAIEDIDNDGDLDILTFYILGTCVEFHKNLSVELTGTADTLIYELASESWGYFTESDNDNTITINDSCTRIAAPRHVGSTLLLHDFDRDDDKDLFLGDVSYNELQVLVNQPVDGDDMIIQYPENYPDFSNLSIPIFPAAFIVTEGNDDFPSLILAPNTDFQSINQGETAVAIETSNDDFDFTGEKVPFLTYQSLDFGRNSYPAFADIDFDGDLDIVVGNFGRFIPVDEPLVEGDYLASISLLRNVGTNSSPEYILENNDVGGLSSLGLSHLAPALADLNNDNFPDMLVGGINGQVMLLIQNPVTGEFELVNETIIETNLDFVTPALQDLNNDNRVDLLLGGKNGRFEYYENTGSLINPVFSFFNSNFEELETIQEGVSNFGYSSPSFFNFNESLLLFSGSESGRVFVWSLSPNGAQTQIAPIDSNFSFISEGKRTGISIADLNNDNLPDMVLGNQRGGLCMFYGAEVSIINEPFFQNEASFLFPNPSSNSIAIGNCSCKTLQDIKLFDFSGRLIRTITNYSFPNPINIQELSSGIYFLQYEKKNGELMRLKFVKQ